MFYEKVKESADYIREQVSLQPEVAIILGSGLGAIVDAMTEQQIISYKDIPHFPQSEIAGHAGNLVFGKIGETVVVAMQGRFHYYEGFTLKEVTYPVYMMKLLGIENLIVTNACGGINLDFQPGDFMLIDDFINTVGTNPLIGSNDERFGPRFPDMSEPYSKALSARAERIAHQVGVMPKHGVYAWFQGPYYETAAEIRMIKGMGADAVGMSTVPETIVANYLGMKVLGIACITNMATGLRTGKHSHEEVLAIANRSSESLCQWVEKLLREWKE